MPDITFWIAILFLCISGLRGIWLMYKAYGLYIWYLCAINALSHGYLAHAMILHHLNKG